MPLTDPLGDMLTRIRNGQQARKDSVTSPASKLRVRVLDVLQREGYIRGYREEALGQHPGLRRETIGYAACFSASSCGNGKLKRRSSSRASSSVFAVVVTMTSMPRTFSMRS